MWAFQPFVRLVLERDRTLYFSVSGGGFNVSEIKHIRLPCTGCTVHLRVDAVHAGKHVKCPECSVIAPIPTIDQCKTWASAKSIAPEPAGPEINDLEAAEMA